MLGGFCSQEEELLRGGKHFMCKGACVQNKRLSLWRIAEVTDQVAS